jgi:hypothetical protein
MGGMVIGRWLFRQGSSFKVTLLNYSDYPIKGAAQLQQKTPSLCEEGVIRPFCANNGQTNLANGRRYWVSWLP